MVQGLSALLSLSLAVIIFRNQYTIKHLIPLFLAQKHSINQFNSLEIACVYPPRLFLIRDFL